MIAPRRFLPSISSLLALEAVERLGTASAAAEDLSLTHSAVSRQLKVLEEQIGVTMFQRKGKGLSLTPAGTDYARTIRDNLHDIARASLKIKAGGERSTLNLAILPTFWTHWLSPRLRGFTDEQPDIVVNLSTRLAPFNFNHETFDAAIHFGQADWPGVEFLELSSDRILPCCAPDLMNTTSNDPADLLSLPLLHLQSRPGAWEEWFERHGCPAERLRGMLFDQYATMTEAAALGFGVALLPEFVARGEEKTGRLIRAYPTPMEVTGRYYLVWPSTRPPSPALDLLIHWLNPSQQVT